MLQEQPQEGGGEVKLRQSPDVACCMDVDGAGVGELWSFASFSFWSNDSWMSLRSNRLRAGSCLGWEEGPVTSR